MQPGYTSIERLEQSHSRDMLPGFGHLGFQRCNHTGVVSSAYIFIKDHSKFLGRPLISDTKSEVSRSENLGTPILAEQILLESNEFDRETKQVIIPGWDADFLEHPKRQ